jgi:hypothetical protein
VTRVITDDATQMLGIIDKHYRDLGKPPSGEAAFLYTPRKPWGLPWRQGAEDHFNWNHEPVSSDRPCF